jgi:ribose-phosphate pyrophosphokinase
VTLQRPGQGHEACFFDNNVPLETIMSADAMVDHLRSNADLQDPIVVVTPNSECVKKARNFQLRLQQGSAEEVRLVAFFPQEHGEGTQDPNKLELLGKVRRSPRNCQLPPAHNVTFFSLVSVARRRSVVPTW